MAPEGGQKLREGRQFYWKARHGYCGGKISVRKLLTRPVGCEGRSGVMDQPHSPS